MKERAVRPARSFIYTQAGLACTNIFVRNTRTRRPMYTYSLPYLFAFVLCARLTNRREIQLQIKDWEVKQAENNRKVKITSSDWLDHPDRYLLELAGRPSYATSSNTS